MSSLRGQRPTRQSTQVGNSSGHSAAYLAYRRLSHPTAPKEFQAKRRHGVAGISSIEEESFGRRRSAGSAIGDSKKKTVAIWPEWNDTEINNEKWDEHKKTKDKVDSKQGKSPVVQPCFDDPEGKIDLPPSLAQKVVQWKRPHEFIPLTDTLKERVVVDIEGMQDFILTAGNGQALESELMRHIVSSIMTIWKQSARKPPPDVVDWGKPPADPKAPQDAEYTHSWRPWEHIYSCKPKGLNMPIYNPVGKYVVKLRFMGSWRKIIIDDTMPFDENDKLLLPQTSRGHELWPMLLSKALIKIASLDYGGGGPSSCSEFGEFNVVQCLTGWIPEVIPLQYGHTKEIWDILKLLLPEFKLPDPPPDEDELEKRKEEQAKEEREKAEAEAREKEKLAEGKDGKGKDKGKDKDKKDDKKGKDKDKKDDKANKDKQLPVVEDQPIPENPEVIIFASYAGLPKAPVPISKLAEMADASEKLRQRRLSHMYPHPVHILQTRSCPLEPPPVPEKVPGWKLIRPRKKQPLPTDLPAEPVVEAPIQCLEIASPFIDYRVSTVPIPTDIHRSKSTLERGATHSASRPVTASQVKAIVELDENKPDPEPVPVVEEPKPVEVKPEEPPVAERSTSRERSRRVSKERKKSDKEEPDKKVSPLPKSPKRGNSANRERLDSRVTSESRAKTDTAKDTKNASLVSSVDASQAAAAASATAQAGQLPATASGTSADKPPSEASAAELTSPSTETLFTGAVKTLWFDYNEFVKCFKSLLIFHKPRTYPANAEYSDLKVAESHQGVVQSSRATASKNAAATAATATVDEKAPHYLFVDSLKPIEIVVSFAALCRWNENPGMKEDSRLSVSTKQKVTTQLTMQASAVETKTNEPGTPESASVADGMLGGEQGHDQPMQRGSLIAEPHSWKSLVIGQPKLRLHTTASKAALLKLPEGRHVLRFYVNAPLAYHVEMCSSTPFVFGEEDKIMPELVKESCLFVSCATRIMSTLIKCIQNFSDVNTQAQCLQDFYIAHCPYYADKTASKQYHFKVFLDAFYSMLRKALTDAAAATPEMAFAWRTFFFDCSTKNILGLSSSVPSRPTTAGATSERASAGPVKEKGKGKKQSVVQEPAPGEAPEPWLEKWKNKIPDQREHEAATKLQKTFKALWVRHMKTARIPGTDENKKVKDVLQKAADILEPAAEQHGLLLLRTMFKTDPTLMVKYPFHRDEWSKISFADYQGVYPEHPAGSWFLIFRDIFYVENEMLCVPKLYANIPTCFIRVVNNDNGEEVKKVFMRVAPAVYKKNKHGYTILAEARTTDAPLPMGKWRMRLIGSLDPVPSPMKTDLNCSFVTKEMHDYYVPNDKNIIMRSIVRVTDDCLASIQLNTSKSDVLLRLSILDREEEILSTVGKGHAVLPAFIFRKDGGIDEAVDGGNNKRSSRPVAKKGAATAAAPLTTSTGKAKRAGSPGHKSRSGSRASSVSIEEDEDRDMRPHKYVIQCVVQRDSWPLSPSQWAHVAFLKEQEKNDLKFTSRDRPLSSGAKPDKPAPAATAAAAPKAGSKDKPGPKGKGKEKEKEKSNSPAPLPFDYTKAHFVLRVVVDGNAADVIEVKKDTERLDELKAMKRAWEEAEPGRMAKAWQSRMQYLNKHMIKVNPEDESEAGQTGIGRDGSPGPAPIIVGETTADSEAALSLEPPRPPSPKEILAPLDLSPYMKNVGETRLLDDEEEQRQLEEKRREIEEWRARRESIEQWRIAERQQRNKFKIEQIQLFERMQTRAEHLRATIDAQWRAYRRKHRPHLASNASDQAGALSDSDQGGSRRSKVSNQRSTRSRATALSGGRTTAARSHRRSGGSTASRAREELTISQGQEEGQRGQEEKVDTVPRGTPTDLPPPTSVDLAEPVEVIVDANDISESFNLDA